jgi:AdoMet-dependent heme synthase
MPIKNAFDFFIQLHLTERCNLRCRHCYQTGRSRDEMSPGEIEEAIREISETIDIWRKTYHIDYSTSFNVTGGEPFLRRDLFDILIAIISGGFDVFLLSNGILIDRKKAEGLFNIGVKGVQVSIEGPVEVHDSIRGRGSFSASLKGVRHLLDSGMQVTLNTTLSTRNADFFMELVGLASKIGVQRLGYSRLVPSGRGKAMIGEMLDKKAAKILYEKIFSIESGDLKIVTGDPIASQLSDKDGQDRGDMATEGCAAGVSGLTILPDGTIVPCRRLYLPIGNIKRDSFREVWATSRVLEALRDRSRYRGKCGECSRWAVCRGCRAIAYAFSGAHGENDFLAEDPQCFVE